ncbi:MAG: hypothetical protein EOO89_05375 [Pedobacter sp.]|nr:MAG: hypothetical protein EOO89_05375 [Pedobacter sp.]
MISLNACFASIYFERSFNAITLKVLAFKNCKNLTRLSLNYTSITDEGLRQLKDMSELQSLNLVGTNISSKGLKELQKLKNLKFLYLYQTKISKSELTRIKKLLPKVTLDTGNYIIPILAMDTTEAKVP